MNEIIIDIYLFSEQDPKISEWKARIEINGKVIGFCYGLKDRNSAVLDSQLKALHELNSRFFRKVPKSPLGTIKWKIHEPG